MQRERATEEFVRLFREINRMTNSDPQRIKDLAKTTNSISTIVDRLHKLYSLFEQHRKYSPNRRIIQAHPEFRKAFVLYEADWQNSWIDALDINFDFELDLVPLVNGNDNSKTSTLCNNDSFELEWALESEFDPDKKTAASDLASIREYVEGKVDDSAFYERAVKSWKWFDETVGVDLAEIERRWHKFPLLIVKKEVSDKHGLTEKKSLYEYLVNVRRAYVFGADLAALAMCRSITEIIIRRHFNNNDQYSDSKEIPLGPLTKRTVDEFPLLKRFNLEEKIKEANQLMHFNRDYDAHKWSVVQSLVRNWVMVFYDVLELVPEGA
jgi:hypothetical protein